jgi:uncharacterized protein YggU (UPF0235/DUF167 family)
MNLTETKDGTLIMVFVKPNQPRFEVKIDGDEIFIFSSEEPVKGKVNKEIIKDSPDSFMPKWNSQSATSKRNIC